MGYPRFPCHVLSSHLPDQAEGATENHPGGSAQTGEVRNSGGWEVVGREDSNPSKLHLNAAVLFPNAQPLTSPTIASPSHRQGNKFREVVRLSYSHPASKRSEGRSHTVGQSIFLPTPWGSPVPHCPESSHTPCGFSQSLPSHFNPGSLGVPIQTRMGQGLYTLTLTCPSGGLKRDTTLTSFSTPFPAAKCRKC